MSSILDALEKLEARRTHSGAPEPPRGRRRATMPLLLLAAAAAFVTGIGLTVAWVRPSSPPEEPASVQTATATPPTVPPSRVAPPATAPAARLAAEAPWAEVVTPPGAGDFSESPAPSGRAAAPPTEGMQRRGGHHQAAPTAPADPRPAAEPAPRPAAAPRPAGAPAVRVSFLVFSAIPERRSVALTIDDAGLVTLHEGEKASGLSVARILADGVELTWNGETFTVPARN